jgi:hypothetical protein
MPPRRDRDQEEAWGVVLHRSIRRCGVQTFLVGHHAPSGIPFTHAYGHPLLVFTTLCGAAWHWGCVPISRWWYAQS